MASTLEVKLQAAAAANPALAALLGSPFRWYDTQLDQPATFPAVVVYVVSNPRDYSFTARMATSWARVQFTIWGGQFAAGSMSADAVRAALLSFLDQFNAVGIPGLVQYPCRVVGDHRAGFTQTDTMIYQRVIDAMIFSNESL